MKKSKVVAIVAFTIILITSLIASMWYVIARDDIGMTLEGFRRRRSNKETTTNEPQWIGELMQKNENRSETREIENLLASALGKLEISSPEDLMKYTSIDNCGCKELRHSLNIFERNYKGDLKSNWLYVALFRAVATFHRSVCRKSEQCWKHFVPHQRILIGLHEQFADCEGQPDWFEKNATFACAEAKNIIKCYHRALQMEADSKLINIFIRIFQNVINAALSERCQFAEFKSEKFTELSSCSGDDVRLDVGCAIFTFLIIILFQFLRCAAT
jgi:hypothetical protein